MGFSAADARAAGMNSMQLTRALRQGRLARLCRGVYVTPGATWTEQAAAVLAAAAGVEGVISHGAAARLHQLAGFESAEIELTVPPGRSFGRPPVKVHHSHLDEGMNDLCEVAGLPRVTSLARTILDLAATAPELSLRIALECAWCKDPDLLDDIEDRLRLERGRRWRGVVVLRKLIADARRRARPMESPLEVRLWHHLASWPEIPTPVAGADIRIEGHGYRYDFLFGDQRLIVETDGWRWHKDRHAEDCRKQTFAASAGFRVMKLVHADLMAPEEIRRRLVLSLGTPPPVAIRSGGRLRWPSPWAVDDRPGLGRAPPSAATPGPFAAAG